MNKSIKYLTIFLPLLPILNIYGTGIPGVSIGKIFILYIILLAIIKQDFGKPDLPSGYKMYFIYMLIIPQFFSLISGYVVFKDVIYKSIGSLVILIIFSFCYKYIDYKYFIRIYGLIVIICSVFFLIQELGSLAGIKIVGIIPGIPLADGESSNLYVDVHKWLKRSASFFQEPAHFAQFLVPYLVICLFTNRSKFINASSVFVSIIIFLLRSGNGYFAMILAWGVWLIKNIVDGRNRLKSITLVATLITILFLSNGILLSFLEKGDENVLSRVEELSSTNEGYSSGFLRIYRGYYLFNELTIVEKVFGIGQGNLKNYIYHNPVPGYAQFSMNDEDLLYLNGVQENLIYGGIIGLSLYLLFIFRLMKGNTMVGKTILLTIILISLMASTYNSIIILIMYIIAALEKKEWREVNEKNYS